LFVAEGERTLPEGAEPFDMPGVQPSHRQGHATFHTMLDEYHLKDPVLGRIARLVDEADVVEEVTLELAAPGLDFICRGLRRISPDDQVALERGRLIYDALYAQISSELSEADKGDPADTRPGADAGSDNEE
jgi:hypothetical protein